MPARIRYGKLCEAKISHAYFLDQGAVPFEALSDTLQERLTARFNSGELFEIVPTAATLQRMQAANLIFKPTQTGFMLGVRLQETAGSLQPFVPLPPDLKLFFGLKPVSPYLTNFSGLPLQPPPFAPFCWHFFNASGNQREGRLFLHRPIPDFSPSRAYEAGEVYLDGNELFEAIRATGPSGSPVAADWRLTPPDTFSAGQSYRKGDRVLAQGRVYQAKVDQPGNTLSDGSRWAVAGDLPHQFAHAGDRMAIRPGIFKHDVSSAALNQARVRIFSVENGQMLSQTTEQAVSGSLKAVPVSVEGLPQGRYRLEIANAAGSAVTSLGMEFLFLPEAITQGWFGVVEITNPSGVAALTDAAGAILSPVYELRFRSRATRWQYHFPKAQPVGPGAEVQPLAGSPEKLITPNPIPLTLQAPGIRLQADNASTSSVNETVILPRPGTDRIRAEQGQWYSDIYLSNLPL